MDNLIIKKNELFELQNNEKFWTKSHKEISNVNKELTHVTKLITEFSSLESELIDSKELYEIATQENDTEMRSDAINNIDTLLVKSEKIKTVSFFSGKFDSKDCFLEIQSGVGGTDCCDCSEILMRMYTRWATIFHDFKCDILSYLPGDSAGIKSALLKISGSNAYGWAHTESGVHRIVRISPFNSNAKRQTSFVNIRVTPVIDDSIQVEIDPKDLKIDTYRSSGAGGQHVNTTDSAIRITHIPTRIVVQCQNNRSQHQNKKEAMNVIRSKIYEMKRQEQFAQKSNIIKTEIGWGNQIRSYVMQPYRLVKDLRTNHESSNIQKILDGDIDEFIIHTIAHNHSNQ